MDDKLDILIIAGATGVGKSDFALDIAAKADCEIISCDSMQIYKGLDIGTAKMPLSQRKGIPHHMIDIIDAGQEYSVSQYSKSAERLISDIHDRKKFPLVVGGTGLYIESFVYPLTFIKDKNDDVRNSLLEELNKYGNKYMHDKLKEIDPVDAEKIHPNNTKRLLRALEIYITSGSTKSAYQERTPNQKYNIEMIVLNSDRETLYERISKRVNYMFSSGLADEVDAIVKRGISWEAQSMQAIGYKEFKPFYDGIATLNDVKNTIITNTKRYAKRQLTWFRRYDFAKWFDITTEYDKALLCAENFIRRKDK